MKKIGLIGGLTWLSTLDYYRLLNQKINYQIGGVNSAEVIMYSVNFGPVKALTEAGKWDEIAAMMQDIAFKLQQAGADCLMIGANTMHKLADDIQKAVTIPIIHIAEATASVVVARNLHTVALLGTKYTMQLDFYKNKLADKGITTIIPAEEEITYINDAIYNEMGKGIFLPETKDRFIQIINQLIDQGAQGIILGCTEIPILIKQADCSVPVFDTTDIHADAAVAFALESG